MCYPQSCDIWQPLTLKTQLGWATNCGPRCLYLPVHPAHALHCREPGSWSTDCENCLLFPQMHLVSNSFLRTLHFCCTKNRVRKVKGPCTGSQEQEHLAPEQQTLRTSPRRIQQAFVQQMNWRKKIFPPPATLRKVQSQHVFHPISFH